MLTSATKRVDVAVEKTIETVEESSFAGARDVRFDVANGGVGYGKVSKMAPDRAALLAKLEAVAAHIADGAIVVPRK